VRDGDKTYAWKVKGNALSRANLAIGPRDPRTGGFEVKNGLAAGDTVLRHPNSSLKDGQKVELSTARVASAASNPAPAK
jgi:hypothetical protein